MAGWRFNGQTIDVPSAVSMIEVIQAVGAPLPNFGITLIVARGRMGTPGLAHTMTDATTYLYPDGEADPTDRRYVSQVAELFSESGAVGRVYGTESDAAIAFKWFKKGGAGAGYVMNPAANTRVAGSLLNPAPASTSAIDIWSREFGAPTCHIFVNVATAAGETAIEVTKPRNVRFLSAKATAGDTYIDIEGDVDVFSEGATFWIDDVSVMVPEEITVDTVDAVNKRVHLTAALAGTFDIGTGKCGHVYTMNFGGGTIPISPDEIVTGLTTNAQLVDWFQNTSTILDGIAGAGVGMPVTMGAEPEGYLGKSAALKYTRTELADSPDMTAANWGYFIDEIKPVIREYIVRQIVVVDNIDDDAALNSTTGDWTGLAIAMRASQPKFPLSIITGCALGDVFEGVDANPPTDRAAAFNSDDIILCDLGLDGLDGYKTFAPWLAGNLSSHKVNHNLTRDIIPATTVERKRIDYTEIGPIINGGVVTAEASKIGLRVARGVNTLQNNSQQWTNETPPRTFMIMQRNEADYVDLTVQRGVDNDQIGMDGITPEVLKEYVISTGNKLRDIEGVIVPGISPALPMGFKIIQITRSPSTSSWAITWSVTLDQATDFIGITTQIVVEI